MLQDVTEKLAQRIHAQNAEDKSYCKNDEDKVEIADPSIDIGSNAFGVVEELVENPKAEEKFIPSKKRKLHKCLICSQTFSQNGRKHLHMRKVHDISMSEKSSVKCLEYGCNFRCGYKEKLQWHLSYEHNIKMDMTIKKFSSSDDFVRWKEEFELQEKSRFVKKSGARPRHGGIIMSYFYCNRSGAYVSQGKGIKRGKRKGSAKSNNYCTASITCMELPDGKVDVKVCSTHYGHDTDLQHLRLSRSEKFRIAEQLSRGVPRELVLDDVRASAGPKVERIHLITMKDIKNIEKAFGIQSISNAKEGDMFSNLHVWVSNTMLLENSPVLFFQDEGVSNTSSHDVTLILLTKGQMEVLQKYGNQGTFFISTTVLNNSQTSLINQKFKPKNLYITTVMVVDELNESFPVSFMMTNKNNDKKYELLFGSLKKRVPNISAKVVLTDCKEEIYMWWCRVFQEIPNHYWSNRFIDSDWRENLISIVDEDLQVSIYERLYSFLESNESDVLLSSLNAYVSSLQENPLTIKFTEYFSKIYIGSEKYWAGCFGKLDVPVSAQLNMEVFCNHLLELCEKKHWDRNFVVKTIQNLLKMANDKQCDRQSKLERQIYEMSHHHDLGVAIKPEYVIKETESSWRVESLKDPKKIFSTVGQQNPECSEPASCVFLCNKCNACAHQMRCSCRVYSYDHTMCKHMHAVAINYFSSACDTEEKSQSDNESEKNSKLTYYKIKVKKEESTAVKKELPTCRRKVKIEESTGVRGVLPVIEEILSNKHITKSRTIAKRKTSSKNKDWDTINENDKDLVADNRSHRLCKRKMIPPKINQETDNNSEKHGDERSLITRIQRRRSERLKKGTVTVIESENEPLQKINTLRTVINKPSKLNL